MKRSDIRILTSHTGGLALPPRDDHAAPQPPTDKPAIKQAVRAIVDKQIEVGVDVINNGEKNASLSWFALDRIFDGLEHRQGAKPHILKGVPDEDMETYAEYYEHYQLLPEDSPMLPPSPAPCVCAGPVSAKDPELLRWDVQTLREAAEGKDVEELFHCFISPGWLRRFIWDEHYGSEEKLLRAMAEAVKPYYKAIVDAGLILQIDSPDIVDDWSWDRWRDVTAYRKNLEMRLEAMSNAISGLPEDRVRLHFCWGSWHGPHSVALPLEKLLDLVYAFPAQCYSIEAAKPNHTHEWRAFEEFPLPDGKIVMPGVIDHTTPVIEHPRVIADRIVAYANVVGKENVIAGTDCGMRFDSRVEWAKLERMAQGAELATKELFG